MRRLIAVALATSLIASNAIAAENTGALAPGKPAGVKQAAISGGSFFWILGLAFLGAGIGIAASGNGGNNPGTTTNTLPSTGTNPPTTTTTTTTTTR